MTEEPGNLPLILLRRLDTKVDHLIEDNREVKQRLGALEEGQASLSRRLDRMQVAFDRIERRFDLVDTPTTA